MFPRIMYCFVIKSLWMLFYIGYKTNEFLPTTNGIASSSVSSQLSMLITAGFLCLTFFFDFLSVLQGQMTWIGFASFGLLALWTRNAIFMPLLVVPPLLDYLHELWRSFTDSAPGSRHRCNYDEAAKRMAGLSYHYAQVARHREREQMTVDALESPRTRLRG